MVLGNGNGTDSAIAIEKHPGDLKPDRLRFTRDYSI